MGPRRRRRRRDGTTVVPPPSNAAGASAPWLGTPLKRADRRNPCSFFFSSLFGPLGDGETQRKRDAARRSDRRFGVLAWPLSRRFRVGFESHPFRKTLSLWSRGRFGGRAGDASPVSGVNNCESARDFSFRRKKATFLAPFLRKRGVGEESSQRGFRNVPRPPRDSRRKNGERRARATAMNATDEAPTATASA